MLLLTLRKLKKSQNLLAHKKPILMPINLPEYVGEEGGTNLDIDIADRDQLI